MSKYPLSNPEFFFLRSIEGYDRSFLVANNRTPIGKMELCSVHTEVCGGMNYTEKQLKSNPWRDFSASTSTLNGLGCFEEAREEISEGGRSISHYYSWGPQYNLRQGYSPFASTLQRPIPDTFPWDDRVRVAGEELLAREKQKQSREILQLIYSRRTGGGRFSFLEILQRKISRSFGVRAIIRSREGLRIRRRV